MKKIFFVFVLIFFAFTVVASPIYAVYAEGDYESKSVFLMDYNTGTVLFEKNSEEKLPIASIIKLMTILLTIEDIEQGKMNLDDVVVVSENASSMGGSQVFLEAGGEYSIGNLLKSVIISSANDASVALAEVVAGSESNFVELMNQRAKQLNLNNTNYKNATGLPILGQYSTAKDIAVLLKEVTKHDIYHNYSTIWMDRLMHKDNRESELVNTNKLIRYYNGCDGGKTGSTNEAGFCLAATAKRGDMRLIAVVLGAKTGKLRFAETSKVLNYGFNTFENRKVLSAQEELENQIKVVGGKENCIKSKSERDLYLLTKKGSGEDINIKIDFCEEVSAPINIGDAIGKIYVLKNGEVVGECNAISASKVEKSTFKDRLNKVSDNWKVA